MTHSAENSAAGDFSESNDTLEPAAKVTTFEDRVNSAASSMVQNEDSGLWELPADSDLPKEVAFAANLEKRRRDTQSELAKTSQQLSATKARSANLESKLLESFVPSMTDDQADELENLRSSDPEAYRQKMNEYEAQAQEAFEEELADSGFDDDEVAEMADRAELLSTFLDENPGLVLNDGVVENDLPPRITGALERGDIDFVEFLNQARTFLTKGTRLADTTKDDVTPDLSKAGGGSVASATAVAKDSEQSYMNEIY